MAGDEARTARLDLLKIESEIVQGGIGRYGDVQFTIKGWAITIFSAFVIFALQYKQPVMLVACGVTVALFWLLDAFYKSLQRVYIDRACAIEELVNGFYREDVPGSSAQSTSGEQSTFDLESKFDNWEKSSLWENFRKYGWLPQIKPLYLVMLGALVFLYALDWTQFSPWVLASEC